MRSAAVDPAEPQTLAEILDWRNAILEALREQRANILNHPSHFAASSRFFGMTREEIQTHFDSHHAELDKLTVLNLVACTEASIRLDYLRRIDKRLKDLLSKCYRKWRKDLPSKKKRRPNFEGDNGLLMQIESTGALGSGGKRLLSRFRECLPPRHWVAHGRYWPRPVVFMSPEIVYERASELLQAIETA